MKQIRFKYIPLSATYSFSVRRLIFEAGKVIYSVIIIKMRYRDLIYNQTSKLMHFYEINCLMKLTKVPLIRSRPVSKTTYNFPLFHKCTHGTREINFIMIFGLLKTDKGCSMIDFSSKIIVF